MPGAGQASHAGSLPKYLGRDFFNYWNLELAPQPALISSFSRASGARPWTKTSLNPSISSPSRRPFTWRVSPIASFSQDGIHAKWTRPNW